MCRIGAATCLLAILFASSLPSRAYAQVHVDFGFHGGHHGHYHHGCYHGGYYGWHGYGWYPRYVYPAYGYVYAAPPTAPQTIYVQPSNPASLQSQVDLSAVPKSTTVPLAAKGNTLPAQSERRVVIRNAASSEASVFFLISGTTECELAPGEVKVLNETTDVVVEFDRGGKFGTSTQELSKGTYEFTVTDQGWKLLRSARDEPQPAPRVVKKNSLPTDRRID